MSDYNLGTARGVIEVEYKGDGAKDARKDIENLGATGESSSNRLGKAGKAAGAFGLVVAGGFALAGKTAADFEEKMSAVAAVSGASATEMDALRDKALQLGKDTAFSASESALAMEELVKAGLSVEDVLNGAADATVALAAAGGVDMATAATISSNAMNAFSLGAKDMVGVVDELAGAANASAIDVNDIGEAMKYVGGIAKTAGASFSDMNTAVALLGNYGIKGSQAGTTLRAVLQRLNPTTKKQTQLFQELGLMTEDGSNKFYDAQGNLKSMAEVSEILGKSMNGLTKQQKQQALTTLFGAQAVSGAAILAENGAKGFNKMADAIGKTSAADVAATRMDNFKGSLEEMQGALETVGITIGTILLPAMKWVVEAVGAALNAFLDLPTGVQKGIAAFVGILGVAGLALFAFVKIVKGLQAVKLAFLAVRAAAIPAWLAALGPIALVVAAIAAVVAIVVLLWNKSETFKTAVLAIWNAIQVGAAAVAAWFTGTFLPAIVAVWNGIRTAATTVWSAIIGAITAAIGVIRAVFVGGLNGIKAVWGAVWRTFGPLVKAIFKLITAIFKLWWTVVKGLFLLGVRAVRTAVTAGFNAVKAVINGVMNAIRAVISAVWSVIGGKVKATVAAIRAAVTVAWNAVKTVTSSVWNGLKPIVSGAINGVMTVVNGVKAKVLGALNFAGEMYTKGKEIIQSLIDGIASMVGAVTDKVKSVTGAIGKFLPGSPVEEGPLKVINKGYAGKRIVGDVLAGMESMRKPVEATMTSLLTVRGLGEGMSKVGMPQPVLAGAPTVAPRAGGAGGANPTARLVQGTLKLDSSGYAFIAGVAEDVFDEFAGDFNRRAGM